MKRREEPKPDNALQRELPLARSSALTSLRLGLSAHPLGDRCLLNSVAHVLLLGLGLRLNLWLGANVMVEYSFDEARKLLGKNLENAKVNLERFVRSHPF